MQTKKSKTVYNSLEIGAFYGKRQRLSWDQGRPT